MGIDVRIASWGVSTFPRNGSWKDRLSYQPQTCFEDQLTLGHSDRSS